MADLYKGILGPMRGKIDGLVGRYMYGKALLQSKGQMGVVSGRVDPSDIQFKMGGCRYFASNINVPILKNLMFPKSRRTTQFAEFVRLNIHKFPVNGLPPLGNLDITNYQDTSLLDISFSVDFGSQLINLELFLPSSFPSWWDEAFVYIICYNRRSGQFFVSFDQWYVVDYFVVLDGIVFDHGDQLQFWIAPYSWNRKLSSLSVYNLLSIG